MPLSVSLGRGLNVGEPAPVYTLLIRSKQRSCFVMMV